MDAPSGLGSNAIVDDIDSKLGLVSTLLGAIARISIRKNSAGSVFSRRRINLIEGSNVTITVADDSGSEEVDVTIAATGSSNVTKKATMSMHKATAAGGNSFLDTTNDSAFWNVAVPEDYVSGDITFVTMNRNNVGSNTVALRRSIIRFRDATATNTIENLVNWDRTVANTNSVRRTATLAAANFTHGDVLRLTVDRLGTDGSDNNTGIEDIDGVWIEYLGVA